MIAYSVKWMKAAVVLYTFVTAIAYPCICAAQEKLTLSECVEMALKRNHAIEQAQNDMEEAKWSLSEARRAAGPTLSWNFSGMRIGGKSYESARKSHDLYGTPAYKNEFINSLAVTLPIYTGGELEGQRDAARFGLYSSDLSLEDTRQQVRYRTTAAYYQVLQSRSMIAVQEQAVKNLEEHLAVVNTQFEIGTVAKSDVLATSVQLANQTQSLNKAWGNYRNACASLCNTIGLPVMTELTLADETLHSAQTENTENCISYPFILSGRLGFVKVRFRGGGPLAFDAKGYISLRAIPQA